MKRLIGKTNYSNLARNSKTGVYYARTKVNGKERQKSLGTDKLSTARRMLPRVLESLKEEAGKQYKFGLYYIAELYLQQSEENPNLSPKTKRYHREVVKLFKKTWKGPIEVEDVTKRVYVAYLAELFESYSISRVNAIQSLIMWIGKWALENDVIPSLKNYTGLPRRTHKPKKLKLPNKTEFAEIEEAIRLRYQDYTSWTYWGVIIVSRTGARLSELKAITWGDIDWENCETCIKTAKGREREIRERHVPFIGGVERIYRQLRTELSDRGFPTGEEDPIIPIVTFNKAIKLAFKDMGRKSLTLHDFRHLFATRCIESGVDIQTVSRWLGHEDGGTLAMKTYVHLLNSHSKKMAEKVEI